jgi:hypothetical protein
MLPHHDLKMQQLMTAQAQLMQMMTQFLANNNMIT